MKFEILMGSPRKKGNTITLVRPFMEELQKNGHETDLLWLNLPRSRISKSRNRY